VPAAEVLYVQRLEPAPGPLSFCPMGEGLWSPLGRGEMVEEAKQLVFECFPARPKEAVKLLQVPGGGVADACFAVTHQTAESDHWTCKSIKPNP